MNIKKTLSTSSLTHDEQSDDEDKDETSDVEEKGGGSEAMIETVSNSISEKVAEQVAKKMMAKLNPRIDEILDGIRESDNNKTKMIEEIVGKPALSKITNIVEWNLFEGKVQTGDKGIVSALKNFNSKTFINT